MLRIIYASKNGPSKEVTLAANFPESFGGSRTQKIRLVIRNHHNWIKRKIGEFLDIPTHTVGETKKFIKEINIWQNWQNNTLNSSNINEFHQMAQTVTKYDDSVVFFEEHWKYRFAMLMIVPIVVHKIMYLHAPLFPHPNGLTLMVAISGLATLMDHRYGDTLIGLSNSYRVFSNKMKLAEILSGKTPGQPQGQPQPDLSDANADTNSPFRDKVKTPAKESKKTRRLRRKNAAKE